jgi:hypothetical protein
LKENGCDYLDTVVVAGVGVVVDAVVVVEEAVEEVEADAVEVVVEVVEEVAEEEVEAVEEVEVEGVEAVVLGLEGWSCLPEINNNNKKKKKRNDQTTRERRKIKVDLPFLETSVLVVSGLVSLVISVEGADVELEPRA